MSKITEYLEARNRNSEDNGVENRKLKWLEDLELLFSQIEQWISEAIASNLIFDYRKGEIQITEESIGSYMVPESSFSTAKVSIRIIPKGTFIIGAEGRVDMHATTGRQASLVVIDGKWQHVDKRSGRRTSLDEDAFLEILKYLLER